MNQKRNRTGPNALNERIKHEYFVVLREVRQLSEQSVDAVAKALQRFEEYTGHKDFRTFGRDRDRLNSIA